ncbi:MAG TPA: 5-(carboxyamino)imidazole ribonucleotide synthase [Vicinamibacterales bacterium]|nr:5-(carboxyamino)imidazole ribonucleotide synthase [Vicinamibacterales bacterium]
MTPILPGSTIGVLGSGQLGRMFAMAARRMGYRVHTFSPGEDTPTGQIADREITASYDDLDAVAAFARGVDVVTFEFENVSSESAEVAARYAPVRPSGLTLHVTQQRAREKGFLADHGFPVAPFAWIRTREDLAGAIDSVGTPAVLKTAAFGYDGKGQYTVRSAGEAAAAWDAMGRQEAVLERFIDFERELSLIVARGVSGWTTTYGLIENTHTQHILDTSVYPTNVDPRVEQRAKAIVQALADALELVGVACVEFFLTRDGELLINEIAPRPHNSGHLTIEACMTSQFEQQLRAICGLPPGSTELLRPAAMANLLGNLWERGEPNWPAACLLPGVHLHLYGKTEARPGRKMGHLTALAPTPEEALRLALEARAAL